MTDTELRDGLRTYIQALKREYFAADPRPWSPERAVTTELVPDHRNGETVNRLFVILCGPGCWYALSDDGPCNNCGFLDVTTHGAPVSAAQYVGQLERALMDYDLERQNIRELDLYNAGSFFCDEEIDATSREALMGRIAGLPSVEHVLVDCHVRDVDAEKIRRARRALGDKTLELGIGLESADEFIRNVCINKGTDLDDFERAARVIRDAGARLAVYLLFKPAFLSEDEAIRDAIRTLHYVFDLAETIEVPIRVSVEPAVIQGISLLPHLHSRGMYTPPWLWSIVEVLRATAHRGEIRVGVPEEEPTIQARPQNYRDDGAQACACSGEVMRTVARYNELRDPTILESLPACECRSVWQRVRDAEHPPLPRRVEEFLANGARGRAPGLTGPRSPDAG